MYLLEDVGVVRSGEPSTIEPVCKHDFDDQTCDRKDRHAGLRDLGPRRLRRVRVEDLISRVAVGLQLLFLFRDPYPRGAEKLAVP